MSLLLESIRIEEGRVMNLSYHIERMKRSVVAAKYRTGLSFPGNFIHEEMIPSSGLHKCRVLYNSEIVSVEILPYVPKKISSLKIVTATRPDYSLKWADRSQIDELLARRGECDDILIVSDGLVTDASYCNVAFEKGGEWFTPASPLLKGTMRQYLLDNAVIKEIEIPATEINEYSRVWLFNAMISHDKLAINSVK
jgi:4-amino-4-deoxychorismate lyase